VDLLAYIDVFLSLAIIGAIMIPIARTFKSVDLGAPTRGI
jgi:DHA2 family multidrug resistance protein